MKKIISALTLNSIRIFLLLIFAIGFTFLVQSWEALTSPVELTLFTAVEYPLMSWILLSFIGGGCSIYLFSYSGKRRLKKSLKDLGRQNKEYLAELDKLRNLSLTDDMKGVDTINTPKTDT